MRKGSRKRETRGQSSTTLDHTVSPRRPADREPVSTVRSTLMRTVLGDRSPRAMSPSRPPASLRLKPSPTLAVRSSGRSYGAKAKSPFLNATLLTPEITQRAMTCARRAIRREVLFAKRGLSGGSPKRHRSKVRC